MAVKTQQSKCSMEKTDYNTARYKTNTGHLLHNLSTMRVLVIKCATQIKLPFPFLVTLFWGLLPHLIILEIYTYHHCDQSLIIF